MRLRKIPAATSTAPRDLPCFSATFVRIALRAGPNVKKPRGVNPRASFPRLNRKLELVPEELVVNLVMILDFRCLHNRSQQPGAAIGGSQLQVDVPALHVFPKNLIIHGAALKFSSAV